MCGDVYSCWMGVFDSHGSDRDRQADCESAPKLADGSSPLHLGVVRHEHDGCSFGVDGLCPLVGDGHLAVIIGWGLRDGHLFVLVG